MLLFLLAFVVFQVGLFVGLQVNANGGTLLWLAAAAIAGLKILWMIRSRKNDGTMVDGTMPPFALCRDKSTSRYTRRLWGVR